LINHIQKSYNGSVDVSNFNYHNISGSLVQVSFYFACELDHLGAEETLPFLTTTVKPDESFYYKFPDQQQIYFSVYDLYGDVVESGKVDKREIN
jgi:hypothetical protein